MNPDIANIKVSVIIPWIHHDTIKMAVDAVKSNIGLPNDHYEILAVEDTDRIGVAKMTNQLVDKAKYDIVCYLCDETEVQPGFMVEALKKLTEFKDNIGFVRLNGNERNGNARFWLAHKSVLKHLDGAFFYEGYNHAYCDNELTDRIRECGLFKFAERSLVKHDDNAHGHNKEIYNPAVMIHDLVLFLERKINRGNVKLGIGIPLTNTQLYSQFFDSWVRMRFPAEFVYLRPTFPGRIDAVRNELIKQALAERCTHIIMMDTDQIYPPDTIQKLVSHYKLPMVGSLIHRRYPPFDPILYRGQVGKFTHIPDKEWQEEKLVEVDATGAGCFIVRCDILAKMGYPWFFEQDGRMANAQTIGEDIYFATKLKDLGYKIYVDTSIKISHMGLMEIDIAAYKLYKKYGTDRMTMTPTITQE